MAIRTKEAADAAVRRRNLTQPAFENEGWMYLRAELLNEADECYAEMSMTQASLASGKLTTEAFVTTMYGLITRWYTVMKLAHRREEIARDNKEAEAFLKEHTGRREQQHA